MAEKIGRIIALSGGEIVTTGTTFNGIIFTVRKITQI
jgi:hypothetical protein